MRFISTGLTALAIGITSGCTPDEVMADVAVDPAPPVLRRLSQSQYEHAIEDLFGAEIVAFVPKTLEPELRLDGLAAIGSSQVAFSPRGIARFEETAYAVAEAALADDHRDLVMPCAPSGVRDDACADEVVGTLGRLAWRRPLTDTERASLVEVAGTAATTLDDFHEGLVYAVAAILQSPDFLMRPELGEDADEGRAYTGYEMAARMAFLLWDSLPDEALLTAAANGDLDTAEGLEAQVERMLADDKVVRGLDAWVGDLLHLDGLDDVQKDPSVFEQFTDGFVDSARGETERFFQHLVLEQDADLRDMLTSRDTFLDRTLARVYGVQAPSRDGFGPSALPSDGPRAGLLGQASLLTLHAHPTSTSATRRGKFVRETLLCEEVPAPPGNVDTSIPEPDPTRPTLRDRIAVHLESPSCAGCHAIMDPIGLSLERFDGTGVFRTIENGVTIDASGDIDDVPFDGLLGLATTIRDHEHFVPCMVDQVSRYALGREAVPGEDEAVAFLVDRFSAEGHRVKTLWSDLITNPLFRRVGEVE